MRSLPYELNDPTDFSMVKAPMLHIGDVVILFDDLEDGGEWVQADVFAARYNRYKNCWEYEARTRIFETEHTPVDGIYKGTTDQNWQLFDDIDLVHVPSFKQFFVIKKDHKKNSTIHCYVCEKTSPSVELYWTQTLGRVHCTEHGSDYQKIPEILIDNLLCIICCKPAKTATLEQMEKGQIYCDSCYAANTTKAA